jgi:hypothetical protein
MDTIPGAFRRDRAHVDTDDDMAQTDRTSDACGWTLLTKE